MISPSKFDVSVAGMQLKWIPKAEWQKLVAYRMDNSEKHLIHIYPWDTHVWIGCAFNQYRNTLTEVR